MSTTNFYCCDRDDTSSWFIMMCTLNIPAIHIPVFIGKETFKKIIVLSVNFHAIVFWFLISVGGFLLTFLYLITIREIPIIKKHMSKYKGLYCKRLHYFAKMLILLWGKILLEVIRLLVNKKSICVRPPFRDCPTSLFVLLSHQL